MEQKTFDDNLKHYFNAQKKEIGDNNFTAAVMKNLPVKKSWFIVIYLFMIIGVLVFIWFNGYHQILTSVNDVFQSLRHFQAPSVHSLSILITFMLVTLSVLLIDKDDKVIPVFNEGK